ncbi:MAG: hypothetical protein J6B48_00395 [Clostridia bacterium]|nr:hypothetical protein [Clostridia bacterium]MBO5314868.1 hypothetical protein [Clostridia bacterium]
MILAIIIDLFLLGIIAYGIYYGVKKGFVKLAEKPVKTVASLVLAYTCCGGFGAWIVAPLIRAPITGYIGDFLYNNIPNVTPGTAVEDLPTLLKIAAAAFNINITPTQDAGVSYVDTLISTLAEPVVGFIAVIIAAIALFFIGKLLFTLAFYLLNKFCSAGLLGKINKVLGIVFGTFMFVLTSWGAAVFISVIFHLPLFDGVEFISGFEGGFVYRFFNAFNPVVLLLSF